MSRTFATKYKRDPQNVENSKPSTETENDDCEELNVTTSDDTREASSNASNGQANTQGQDTAHGAEGVVISHSKRKCNDNGAFHCSRHF